MSDLQPVTSSDLRAAFGCFPSGVTAVCAVVDGAPVGLAASSFTSVSMKPPLVSVCMQHTSETWPRLRTRPRLGLSVLAAGQEEICSRLAGTADRRFVETEWSGTAEGAVHIAGATLWLDCTVHDEVASGDHDIIVLHVHRLLANPATPPLVFHGSRFRRLAEI